MGTKTALDLLSLGSLLGSADASARAKFQPGILSGALKLKPLKVEEKDAEKILEIGWIFDSVRTGSAQFPTYYPGYDRLVVSVVLPEEVSVDEGSLWRTERESGRQVAMTIVEGVDKQHGPYLRGKKLDAACELRFKETGLEPKEYEVTVQIMTLIGPFAKDAPPSALSEQAIWPEAPIHPKSTGALEDARWIYDYDLWMNEPEEAAWYLTNVAETEVRTSRSRTLPKAGMVLIPAGEFMMGSPRGEGSDAEHPQHKVYVDAFYMDKYEVTNAQYKVFLDATDYNGRSDADSNYLKSWKSGMYPSGKSDHPVTWVSWKNATAYAKWAGKRLPTEAEWEKACRAGGTSKYSFGDSASQLGDYAWYLSNSGFSFKAHPVGQKQPNAWGLYDMHGNVWELCSDWFDKSYYRNIPSRNPNNQANGHSRRVIRGGSRHSTPDYLRSAYRLNYTPDFTIDFMGFRCVQDL